MQAGRLQKLEDARDRSPPAAPVGDKPGIASDGGVGIDDDLLAALRSRRDAFADVVDADRGGVPRNVSESGEAAEAKDDADAQLLADLQEAPWRVESVPLTRSVF